MKTVTIGGKVFRVKSVSDTIQDTGCQQAAANRTALKSLKTKRDSINGIISSRNLYAVTLSGMRRVFNCEIFKTGDGITTLTVEDLHNGHKFLVAQTKFQDGYGQEVVL